MSLNSEGRFEKLRGPGTLRCVGTWKGLSSFVASGFLLVNASDSGIVGYWDRI